MVKGNLLFYSISFKTLYIISCFSPLYIDGTVNMDIAVRRIIWGKCINAGQTCIAPDYILCTRQIQNTFVEKARQQLKAWYTDDPKNSPDFCRIVSEKHFT